MYINAVADSAILYLLHDFYNIIFKIKQVMHSLGVNTLPPPKKKGKTLGVHLIAINTSISHNEEHFKYKLQAFMTGTPSPDRAASGESLYRPSYPGPYQSLTF
jgi:hypothetical protein